MKANMKKMKLGAALVLLVAALLLPATTRAEYPVVSTDALLSMMDKKTDFLLVDARSKEEYQEAHIRGAVNIPEKQFEELQSLLPGSKNSLLVFYCNGVKCGKSKRTAKKAGALGYTNLAVYSDGFPVWEERNLPIVPGPEYGRKIETTMIRPAELKALIDAKSGDYVLVDVRELSEFKEGRIPSAVNYPAETFATKQDALPKEKKIIVYCNTGSRSYLAYRKLMKMDYKNINQALFAEWKEAGMLVEK